ncbi:MAG: lipid IV(A) palmitoyltransferase PagP [Gammaproteobacteria bacterium]|nr:lipid IV(A) palmitoyltransferase PagP [Gammaproteobacteria bacterium]
MKKIVSFLLLLNYLNVAESSCSKWPFWTQGFCKRLHQIWTEGDNEFYLSGYAWHNRYTYSKIKIKSYNERAWGGGLGKGFYDETGDWHGLVALAFLDSHKNIEPAAGYAFLKTVHFSPNLSIGAGYSVLITQRPDIFNGLPFAGILPWISVNYRKASISATYIPGVAGAGNVLYIMGKLKFNLL